jgi:hypothetical protein
LQLLLARGHYRQQDDRSIEIAKVYLNGKFLKKSHILWRRNSTQLPQIALLSVRATMFNQHGRIVPELQSNEI